MDNRTYLERQFVENEHYQTIERYVVGLSSNKVWLNTVDKAIELERNTLEPTDKLVLRVVRWKARNDKSNKKLRYWKFHRGYNIRSFNEWTATSNIINSLYSSESPNRQSVTLPTEKIDVINANDSDTDYIDELENEIEVLSSEIKIFRKRFQLMKKNIKQYKSILSEFKSLVDRSNTSESEIHKFLVERNAFWLFGLEYVAFDSKVRFPPGKNSFEFDLMLKRHDGFCDLVELKGPSENLFDRRTNNRSKPNRVLSEAIGQVFTYLYACDIEQIEAIFKPKAIIVIGNDQTDKIKNRRLFSSYISSIDLLTYHELHERGKKLLEYISNQSI